MILKNNINTKKNFYSSVNIAYDLDDSSMIENFIVTDSSINIMEEIFLSLNSSSQKRARMLIGAYGKGKSHILLVLLNMLYKKDINLFTNIINQISNSNYELSIYIKNYIKSSSKLLPVVIEQNLDTLDQTFIYALNQSLKYMNLENLMPNTFFDAAINTIMMWKNSFQKTYKNFCKLIDIDIKTFIVGLENYSLHHYNTFKNLYPELTSGSQFNPSLELSAIDYYNDVNLKLKNHGYNGIFIIYDEFSKYLESSLGKISNVDLKLLQDFAEACSRSTSTQLHLTLITHKDITNYLDSNINKEQIDGWRAISGRFHHIYMSNDAYTDMYQVISSVIDINPKFWNKFFSKYKDKFKSISKDTLIKKIFSNLTDIEFSNLITRCYPLHPVSTFMLPRLSNHLGQNERTIFTFLSNDDNNTLINIVKNHNNDFLWISPIDLFNYFEPIISKSDYTQKPYKYYRAVKRNLVNNHNIYQISILKLLAMIYITDELQILSPTKENLISILSSLDFKISKIEEEIESLVKSNILIYRRSNDFLVIKENTELNVNQIIEDATEKIKNKYTLKEILNDSLINDYLYPEKYNSDFEIIRYFSVEFITIDEYKNLLDYPPKYKYLDPDGKIFIILTDTENDINFLKNQKSKTFNHNLERFIFIFNKKHNKNMKLFYEYFALKQLISKYKKDALLKSELLFHIRDLDIVIFKIYESYLNPILNKSYYMHNNKIVTINRKSELSMLLSNICKKVYHKTPIINNEVINKNYLSNVAYNSRTRLIDAIFNNPLSNGLELEGNGQEVSIMRSTLLKTGVLVNSDDNNFISLKPDNVNMQKLLLEINDFIIGRDKYKNNRCFKDLYNSLILPENGFGLKLGVIPIYIATVIRFYNLDIIVKNSHEEFDLDANLLNQINKHPESYYIERLFWDEERILYLNKLHDIFKEFIDDNISNNKLLKITNAINDWYLHLPKYTKEATSIPTLKNNKLIFNDFSKADLDFFQNVKNLIRKPKEFLFHTLPNIFGYDEFNLDVIDDIEDTFSKYEQLKTNLILLIIEKLKYIFAPNYMEGETLTSIIKNWFDDLDTEVKTYVHSGVNNSILNIFANSGNNSSQFVLKLGRVVTGLRIDDWDNNILVDFFTEIKNFKLYIENFTLKSNSLNNQDVYRIQFGNNDDVKTYKKVDYGKKGQLFYNQIKSSIDMMGQSINDDEKRQILLEILYDLS